MWIKTHHDCVVTTVVIYTTVFYLADSRAGIGKSFQRGSLKTFITQPLTTSLTVPKTRIDTLGAEQRNSEEGLVHVLDRIGVQTVHLRSGPYDVCSYDPTILSETHTTQV